MLTYYLIKEVAHWIVNGRVNKHSDVYRGFGLYRRTKTGKKNILKVLHELSILSMYWNAFPDVYFRMGMFMSDFTDMKRMKSFIPQKAYNRYAADKDRRYHILIDDKIIFHDLMTQFGLPVPIRYFTFRNGDFRKGNILLSDSDVDNILKNTDDERIFVKYFTGGASSGISIFKRLSNGQFTDGNNQIVSASMIRDKYKGMDFIFEKQIIQEPILGKFNPDTVNTIRVLTYKNKIISATVRFGGKGEFVDNVSANGVAVSLDIETGILSDYGMKMYSTVEHFYEHPDSHLKFRDTKVTQWDAVRQLVEKALKYLPYYSSVGFDIATTPDGPVIVEINTGAGINLSQMGKDYGVAGYFR